MENSFSFFGTPRFAEIVLSELVRQEWIPSFVICNPDRPTGRKGVITPPPVKILAQKNSIPVFQPEKLSENDPVFYEERDYFVVAAYGKIIPKSVFELPRFGTIGIHPSLLPKYRGATPIQSAILSGENETGVTLFLIDEKVDHGKIIAEETVSIERTDTYGILEEKLARCGAWLLVKTLPDFMNGKIIPREQDHDRATMTKKIKTEDAFISAETLEAALRGDLLQAETIHRMVRTFTPEPGVWTLKEKKRMKILETRISENKLILMKVQMDGKKPHNL
jgi:methionyl-tRNA formyltransferase